MLVSGLILVLYFWVFFSGAASVTTVLMVPDYAALVAGIAFIAALVSYMWSPREFLTSTALISYTLLLGMLVLLIVSTGLLSSPFIALWMIGAVFSPVFGWYGIGLILLVTAGILGWEYNLGFLNTSTAIKALLMSVLPVGVGYIALRTGSDKKTSEDRAYHELASELSAVSGKSDVVISAIADGVIAISKKGAIQLINPAAQRLLGWGRKDALGLSYQSVLKLIDNRNQPVSDTNNPIVKALSTGEQTHSETFSLATAESGKTFLAAITATPLGGIGTGAIVVFRDITKEKAEEREQAEFISTASHEMRTPVASIEGYLGLALNPQTAQIDERARDYITKAHESAQHLGRLFQDLLDVSKADDGRIKNEPRVIDVVPFMRDIVRGLLPKAKQKHLNVTYKPMPDIDPTQASSEPELSDRILAQVLYVNVDNDHLREVLSNLVENAIKYTPNGSVSINVVGTDEYVTISVTDSGIGIPKEDIDHLFQKFYRVDNSATREIGGTGLGLYLSRRLTEAMGGRIWVESEYQQGSTFYVRLPRVDHLEAKHLIEQSARTTSPTILTEPPRPVLQTAAIPRHQQSAVATQKTTPAASSAANRPPVHRAPAQAHRQAPRTQIQVNTERPPIEALSPQNPNLAPVFQPGQTNTPLNDIERNPGQYIRFSTPAPESPKVPSRYHR